MTDVELLPCPFCGSQHSLDLIDNPRGKTRIVRCLCCMAEGPVPRMSLCEHTDASAIAAWNTRAMPDERALIVAWLRRDAKQCDCFAHEEGECTCGAWWDNKESNVLTLADAIEAGEHMR